MNRLFMFAYQNCLGRTGGGHGVEFRLYEANKKYRYLDDVYFVFGDRVIHGTDDCGKLASNSVEKIKTSKVKKIIKSITPEELYGIKRLREFSKCINICRSYLMKLNDQYSFDDGDVFLFHDLQMAYPFIKQFPFRRVMLISHSQGTYYNEWSAFRGHKSEILRKYYNNLFRKTAKRCMYLGFPARGAEETFVMSDETIKGVVESKKRVYLNSGIECPEIKESFIEDWVKELKSVTVFSTVATLNDAKGVERIPKYLGAIKNRGYDFKWVLVGNGIKAKDVENGIDKYNLNDSVIWIKNPISHEIILQIMSVTDFYILFHRFSVFDLSTLEAMHYGAIPVVTPVGGNKEVIIDNNGIFVDDFSNVESILPLMEEDRKKMRDLNRRIQEDNYNSKIFLRRYAEIFNKMRDAELD